MGHVDVAIEVGTPDRSRFVEIVANVDTGATFTMLPRTLLAELGVQPSRREQFTLADGTPVTKDVGEVPVRLEGKTQTTVCVFGDEGQPPLIGVVTLEQFLLGVDTVNGRLISIPGLLMAHGKKYNAALEKIDENKQYEVKEAIALLKQVAFANFDETAELHIRTGLDSRHAEQQLRGTLTLPHGLGKSQRVLVFAEGEGVRLAEEAGADEVGGDALVKKVEGGYLDFEVALATKEMMGKVGRLGRVLGPRGLMPNPRTNTVVDAQDLPRAIKDAKQGRVEFRTDRTNLVHVPFGKISFSEEALTENLGALLEAIVRERPAGAKGQYIRSITITTTMSPGIRIDLAVTTAMTTAAAA